MKTQYRILWIDDEVPYLSPDIDDIKEYFEDYGIEPNIVLIDNSGETNVHEDIGGELNNPDLDLIVVDFSMSGMDGTELIRLIRNSDHIYLPVIFYSTMGPERLHQEAAGAALDGVYITGRERLRDKIKDVTESLLRKEQTSKRTRGLLMEGVSEIDANFGQLFLLFWDKMDDVQKLLLIAYLKEKIEDSCTEKNKLAVAIPDELSEFREYIENNFVSSEFDTITRWKILKKLFGILNLTNEEVDVFHRLFDRQGDVEPLIPLRNRYGHQTRAELDKSHDDQVCINIRRELRTQTKNLEILSSDKSNDG